MIMMMMIFKILTIILSANFSNLVLLEFPLFLMRVLHSGIQLDADNLYKITRY